MTDMAPWPAEADRFIGSNLAGQHHNQPPLEERLAMDFAEKLAADGITSRIQELVAAADRAPPCTSQEIAGQYGDLIRMAGAATKRVEETRETLNRPLLTAQRTLKARADATVADLQARALKLRSALNGFMAEEERKASEARRRIAEQEEAARQAAIKVQREQEAAARESGQPIPEPVYAPAFAPAPKIEAPVAHGDMGARVGTATVWHHEIESVRQLPDRLLKHAKVIEALDKVIAAEIRGGTHEIKGVRIWDTKEARVR